MKNKSIDLGRLYRVRELAEIFGVNYLTALNTYFITGERIQDRLNQEFMFY